MPLPTPSALVLILANFFPVIGVLFLDWKVFDILAVFWLENVIIGFINILRMATALFKQKDFGSIFKIPFFCLHYGIFTTVHGYFLIFLFGKGLLGGVTVETPIDLVYFILGKGGLLWSSAAIFLSHIISFVINFIGHGEYKQVTINYLMREPYVRVTIMHAVIMLGCALVIATGQQGWALAPLVLIKTAIDLRSHMAEHAQAQRRENKEVVL